MDKTKQVLCCVVLGLSFGQRSHKKQLEKVRDIVEVEIHNKDGKVTVRNSENDETTVAATDNNNVEIVRTGKKLIVKNRKTSFWGGFFHRSKRVDFSIKVAPTVRNLKLNCAGGFLDVENCKFDNIHLDAADLKVRIKNTIGNLFFDCSDVKGVLENVHGNISVDVCSCNFVYIMRDFFSPIKLFFDGTDIKFRAFVADSFRSIGVKRKMKIKQSHLPIFVDRQNCDFNISGDISSGKISFTPLSELNDDILQTISAYD